MDYKRLHTEASRRRGFVDMGLPKLPHHNEGQVLPLDEAALEG
jgi:hypothetical protein